MKTPKSLIVLSLAFIASFLMPHIASAHCQVPCGIYDDNARVHAMLEDAETVAKACKMLAELEGKTDAQSQQQIVRWASNKESHAQKVIATISDYFLTQRVKASQEDYAERLEKHHAVIVASMKAKQNADLKYAEALIAAIDAVGVYYPAGK